MRDYAVLEALAAQNPRLNDMRITTPTQTFSMRSDFGLWLNRDSPQIGKPETNSMFVEVPGADFLLDLTCAIDGQVHYKKRVITMELTCDRPKAQWASIRYQLDTLLQGQWLRFYFTRDGEVWAGQFDAELIPGEYQATVSITATCDPWPKDRIPDQPDPPQPDLPTDTASAVLGQAVLGKMVLGRRNQPTDTAFAVLGQAILGKMILGRNK